MRTFMKIFLASFLAFVVFALIIFLIGLWLVNSTLQPHKPDIGSKGLLVLDLNQTYTEQEKDNPLTSLTGDASENQPGLYDIVRMLHYAKSDSAIKGLYIKAGFNSNGFATCEELRKAVLDFKQSKKFVIAYGETMDQKSYYVSSAAQKIYCNPAGGIDWDGMSVTLLFMKNLLDKLGIDPQIFYAGKFKSATEPLRVTQMTEPNRLQTSVLLGDLYGIFLKAASTARGLDTAYLHQLSFDGAIRTASDALRFKLVDGLRYDDQIKSEILKYTGQKETDKINFVSLGSYAEAVDFTTNGDDKIAIIYAQGDIVGGKGSSDQIGSDDYIKLLRKVRQYNDVKAIVFRVNSPGGSSLASEEIWREISLAKKVKPVVVSMGDYAASGGYYISCNADSIFADEASISGSIGVFSIVPNFQPFFNNKLGITFDGVKTAPYADMGSVNRPLTETEKRFMQASVDTVYDMFKTRVANGRKQSMDYIDSIAQGHVYAGERLVSLKLADKTGTLQDALNCAARLAKLKSYRTKEYPEKKSLLERLLSGSPISVSAEQAAIRKNIGEEDYSMLQQIKSIKDLMKSPQAKLPFDINFH